MPSFRGRRRLVCFYCGRRSDLSFQGQNKFNCSSCEATNWLDEHGEITDPPTVNRTPVQYAIPRAAGRSPSPMIPSPEPLSQDSLFCATCLRNQHMLRSSLAQFEWPENSTGAEYLAREKKYQLLRKDLENRYPQVCADCEPRVEKRLHQASYTAQTDHLKRMINKTRSQRSEIRSWTALDILDIAGKWAWHASYLLQFAWHFVMLRGLLAESLAASDLKSPWISYGVRILRKVVWSSPSSQRILSLAINLGLCSFPWNPRFKQSIRGFTAHILGFKQWYTFQLLALLVRLVSLSASQYAESHGITSSAQLGAQVFLMIFSTYIYRMAPGSIKTDTTPLFRQPAKRPAKEHTKPARPAQAENEPGSLADALDDVLREPSKPSPLSNGNLPTSRLNHRPVVNPSPLSGLQLGPKRVENNDSSALLGSLNLSGLPAKPQEVPPVVHYDEEMDWSPSTSQHRAFNTYNSYNLKNPNPRFNDIPVEPKAGPIWYKVPPAPTNPAQRLRNPPSRPIIRETVKSQKTTSIFARDHQKPVRLGSPSVETSSSLNIAEPKFYAPEPRNDPRDGLSSMFASSFSISHGEEVEQNSSVTSSTDSAQPYVLSSEKRLSARVPELIVLLGALFTWNTAARTTEKYGSTIAMASLCACLMVSLRLLADLLADQQVRHGKEVSPLRQPSWAGLAAAQAICNLALLSLAWSGHTAAVIDGGVGTDSFLYGNVLFGAVIAHQLRHILI